MDAGNHSIKKQLTTEQAFQKITAFCSFRDRTRKEITDKLYAIGASKDIVKNLILKLEEEGYLDEERMARSYAGGKFRVKAWGRKKIHAHMKNLGLTGEQITKGMEEINGQEYLSRLADLFDKKWENLHKEEDERQRLAKTIRFLMAKGYESDLIWAVIRQKNWSLED
ncbi:MAG TPA: regulatory protein RecX [Cytophagaceae bacterium]|jgi:regulatory protein|nr:regulatory protein RecX [Cytophagaceae bacterium]